MKRIPFKLETELEKLIASDQAWRIGIQWGTVRPGHPEGKVGYHIADVLDNIDQFFGNTCERQKLRLIALIHDTFKYKQDEKNIQQSHGHLARKFAELYVKELDVLEVIELHDEAYKAYLAMSRDGQPELAKEKALDLKRRLGDQLDLFLDFYFCDSYTLGKSLDHYYWFLNLVSKKAY